MAENDARTIDIVELHKLLPHRYPFLLVDRIVDIDGDASARGIKNVTMNEPQFTGHFPGNPIMPGVLIVEGMAQTAGAVVAAHHAAKRPQAVYLMTMDGVKFRKPVVPGDVLEYHITKRRQVRNIFKYDCVGIVGGQKVAEAQVSAMMVSDADGGPSGV